MQFRYLLLSTLVVLSFACGGEEPSTTVNQTLALRLSNGVRQPMSGGCFTVQRGHDTRASPNSEPTYYKPDSLAPDLEQAVTWSGQFLFVAMRIAGTPNQQGRDLSWNHLVTHSHDTLIINRATAADGAYELQTWGEDPRDPETRGCDLARHQP
jgi:hypothetical protein